MYLIAIGINHRTAPVEIREKLALGKNGLPAAVQEMRVLPMVTGLVALSTCNRTEIYATAAHLNEGLAAIQDYLAGRAGLDRAEANHYFQYWTSQEVVEHLFRVAAGLDSMVLGETEILGQVRDAYEVACRLKTGNSIINNLFQEAIKVGKRVRTETGIDQHPASVSYTAVELVRQNLGDLSGRTVMIIGAGEMGELTLKHLIARGVSTVLVSNRSFERAERLAAEYGGEAIRYDLLFEHLERSDIVISCTSATHFVVSAEKVRQTMLKRNRGPLFFIDIAVPRDIEPEVAQIPGVYLYNIDDLKQVVLEHMEERKRAAVVAEKIINTAVNDYLGWLSVLTVVPTIKALQAKGNEIRDEELKRCLNRLGRTDPRTEKLIRTLAGSIVNKLLACPIMRLKEYAVTGEGPLYSQALECLFDLDVAAGCSASNDTGDISGGESGQQGRVASQCR